MLKRKFVSCFLPIGSFEVWKKFFFGLHKTLTEIHLEEVFLSYLEIEFFKFDKSWQSFAWNCSVSIQTPNRQDQLG